MRQIDNCIENIKNKFSARRSHETIRMERIFIDSYPVNITRRTFRRISESMVKTEIDSIVIAIASILKKNQNKKIQKYNQKLIMIK